MSKQITFKIGGKKFVLPASPDPIEFPWEEELDRKIAEAKSRKVTKVRPKRKRYRTLRKKKAQ